MLQHLICLSSCPAHHLCQYTATFANIPGHLHLSSYTTTFLLCAMDPMYFPTPAYREKDFFNRQKVPGIHPMAYQAVFEPKEYWWVASNDITFSDDNLNIAVSCVRKYITFCDSLEWYHIEVCAVAFDSFYSAMESDHGLTIILPFWVWCDAGTHDQERHNHHRHMIAVSPAGHFIPNVWKNIQISKADVPNATFHPIRKTRIFTFLQLIETIGFFAQRESICEGVKPETKHNFFINRSLPKLFLWSIVTQFRNGLETLISDECSRLSILDIIPIAKKKNNMYQLPIKDLPRIPLNLVFPISKTLKRTKLATKFALNALGKRKLYFEKNDPFSSLSDDQWPKLESEGATTLREAIGEYWWIPSKKKQYYLGIIMPLIKRKAELEEEIKNLKEGLDAPRKKKKNCEECC